MRVAVLEPEGGLLPGSLLADVECVGASSVQALAEECRRGGIDAIVAVLRALDAEARALLGVVRGDLPEMPLVVVVESLDEEAAAEVLRQGVQEVRLRTELAAASLARCVRHAIHRQRFWAHLAQVAQRALHYAADRRRASAKLQQMAYVDQLTGLYNRHGFLALARQQFAAARREGRSLIVVFADLDGLKAINDEFGHAAGDEALQEAADVLACVFRGGDTVARIGGDEFAALAEVPAESASPERAERSIRRRVAEELALRTRFGASRHPLSMSIGLAVVADGDFHAVGEAIARADAEMYRSKRLRPATSSAPDAGGPVKAVSH